jgi:hypothetical protein
MPKAGDVSICFGCQAPLIFADDRGHVRSPKNEEEREAFRELLEDFFGKGAST